MDLAEEKQAIERARAGALEILKPTPAQLEHGLELHAASPVVESYGLGLHAPWESEAIQALVEAGASAEEARMRGLEMALTRWALKAPLRRLYRLAREEAGVTCIFQNAGVEGNDALAMLQRLAHHSFVVDAMPECLVRVFSVKDILRAHAEGKFATCLTTNGLPLTGACRSVEEELLQLTLFAHLGVRMMHLTYNRRNLLGDGCGESSDAGLSDFGRRAIAEMNRLGMIVDIAHSGWKTGAEAAEVSEKPVLISHSAVWELNQHIRCKPESLIRQVVDKGGAMGITNLPAFLGGSGDISAMLDHIEHVARKFGVGAVTIGTDLAYRPSAHAKSMEGIKLPASRANWESLWPTGSRAYQPQWTKPEQLQSMAWTNWPLFTVGLVQRGFCDEDIQAMIGGNMLRIAGEVWKGCALEPEAESPGETTVPPWSRTTG